MTTSFHRARKRGPTLAGHPNSVEDTIHLIDQTIEDLMRLTKELKSLRKTFISKRSTQEDLRNQLQMAAVAFQTTDQRATQIRNMIATILKLLNERRADNDRSGLG